ncbi:MAG: ATP-grasp domain-containing protein [Candidatus Micrarchaeota archaeon]
MVGARRLVLVDGAFASPVLMESCAKNGIPVFAASAKAEAAARKAGCMLVSREEASGLAKDSVVYTTAESMLPIALSGKSERVSREVEVFHDKSLFRRALAKLPEYENFFFKELAAEELLDFRPQGNVVLKPSVGFFSFGVKPADETNFQAVAKASLAEVSRFARAYPESVLRGSKWVVEEEIKGNEFATDAFFDSEGNVRVNAVYRHPFRDENDTRDLLYYTNEKIMREQSGPVKSLLERICTGAKLNLKNLPVHMEYRLRNGVLYPIEVNPWRFAGMGLEDLPVLWGLNQYEEFFGIRQECKPALKEGENYAFILCRNPEGMQNPENYSVDHVGYRRMLESIGVSVKQYQELDHARFGVGSMANCIAGNEKKMLGLLSYDTSPHYVRKK